METIGRFAGMGEVFQDAAPLGQAEYYLEVTQEVIEGRVCGGGAYRIPSYKQIEGTVRGTFPIGTTLTLVTEEQHTLHFFTRDARGTISAEGPLRTKDGKNAIQAILTGSSTTVALPNRCI